MTGTIEKIQNYPYLIIRMQVLWPQTSLDAKARPKVCGTEGLGQKELIPGASYRGDRLKPGASIL